jgi:Glyoxalase/Bleomycin resistance protein/Dioxygenase superfamily
MIRSRPPLAINGMHHPALRVHDVDRSLAFYRDILGFAPKTSFLLDGLRFAMLKRAMILTHRLSRLLHRRPDLY